MGKEFELWTKVKEALLAGDMPPEEDPQLAPEQKEQVTKWLNHSLDEVVRANAGDPGIVTVRRLTNSEYARTIRDLTGGRDYGLTNDFAPDGGGGEGFTNIGDVLFVSEQARIAAGNYVPFVLWANFIGGFLYITAGLLLLLNATQALRISVLIAAYTIAVMIALVVHIALGRAYEIRTLAAMGFRTIFWVTISLILLRTKKK